ncbi:MAG TPA: hypothetical protein GX517_02140 [Alicyclobacillus sp.]|nr:hypothetical protein [Alicyclobacillus sp.]
MTHLAIEYAKRGMSVIPIHRNKIPLLDEWKPYQSRAATPEQVAKWAQKYPWCNWAIVTGAINGIVVLDLDGPEAAREAKRLGLPPGAPVVRTGKGWHIYFAHPGQPVKNAVRVFPGADIRGDGGYVAAPPSVHPSGAVYRWVKDRSIFETELPPMPDWLAELVFSHSAPASVPGRPAGAGVDELERIAFGVDEGERNVAAARLAGYLLSFRRMNPRVAAALMEAWNERNRPPLPLGELYRTIDSIARRQAKREWGA